MYVLSSTRKQTNNRPLKEVYKSPTLNGYSSGRTFIINAEGLKGRVKTLKLHLPRKYEFKRPLHFQVKRWKTFCT